MRKLVVAATATAVFAPPPLAYALNFDFSFTGSKGGTVTGEIFGLSVGQSAATDIQIDSVPSNISLPSLPFNLDLLPPRYIQDQFTVSAGGLLKGADFVEVSHSSKTLYFNLKNSKGTANGFSANNFTFNLGGFGGVTYTPVSAAVSVVPEPAGIALLGAGLAGLAAFRRRRAV